MTYELDQLREQVEWYREREERASRERTEEMEERYNTSKRSARTWPEALRKQIRLCRDELGAKVSGQPLYGPEAEERGLPADDYFGPMIEACEYAIESWPKVSADKQEAIDALKAQLKRLEDSIRLDVARLLEIRNGSNSGWAETARALREDKPESWLNW